jgi:hypothetical protein
LEQIDIARRMIDTYPDVFELALTAGDVAGIDHVGIGSRAAAKRYESIQRQDRRGGWRRRLNIGLSISVTH